MRIVDLLTESVDSIVGLGYPRIVAKLYYEIFGQKLAYLMAKWQRDYLAVYNDEKDWFDRYYYISQSYSYTSLGILSKLYKSVEDSIRMNSSEPYKQERERLGLAEITDYIDEGYLLETLRNFRKRMKEQIINGSGAIFEYYSLPADIISGKLKDINRYKDLKFMEAQYLYDQYRIFEEAKPFKSYKDGFKWINVGMRCPFIGSLMKNCGSAGVMSDDPKRTMLVLFDKNNKPHALVTYSPNQNRISGDEGVAGSPVKSIYLKYILNLAKILNANIDDRTKSRLLRLKFMMRNHATDIRQIQDHTFDPIFRLKINNEVYYSNGYVLVPKTDVDKLKSMIETGEVNQRYVTYHNKKLSTTDLIHVFVSPNNEIRLKSLGFNPRSVYEYAFRNQ